MSFRLCSECFNSVTPPALNTVFVCPHCNAEIVFVDEQSHMSTKAPQKQAEDVYALCGKVESPHSSEANVGDKAANVETWDDSVFEINDATFEVGSEDHLRPVEPKDNVTIFDSLEGGREQPKEVPKNFAFTSSSRTTRSVEKRDNVEQSIFDVGDMPSTQSYRSNSTKRPSDEVELLVRESVGVARAQGKVSRNKRLKGVYILVTTLSVLVLGITFVLLFLFYQRSAQTDISEAVALKKVLDKDHKVYSEIYDSTVAHDLLEKFFEASTPNQALQYILPDRTIAESVRKYWRPTQYDRMKAINAIPMSKHEGQVYYFECTNDELNVKHIYPVISSKWQETPLVDWRFPSQIQDMPISEAIEVQHKGFLSVRCGITVEDYYNYRFSDREKWQSFSCWDTISYTDSTKNRIDAYVAKGSELHQELLKEINKQSGFIAKQASLIHVNTQIEMLHNEPVGLEKIRLTNTLPPYKGNANIILELNIVDPQNNVAEITKIISTKVVDYYEQYQLPYLVKRK